MATIIDANMITFFNSKFSIGNTYIAIKLFGYNVTIAKTFKYIWYAKSGEFKTKCITIYR